MKKLSKGHFILGCLFLLTFLKATKALSSSSSIDLQSSGDGIRLPKDLLPKHYLVRLQPFVNGNLSIAGYVEIRFKVVSSTNRIILHINDIITYNDTVQVTPENSDVNLEIESQEYDGEKQFYIATLKTTLEVEKTYVIKMHYQAYLNDALKGFYISSYKDENGQKKFLGTSQFQPTDARRAFPCFDEPDFKAQFSIQMTRESSMSATLSNMPLNESIPLDDQPGWTLDRFQTSPPMSTYLVAFIVSDFEVQYSEELRNYQFGVGARKNVIDQTEYALNIGPKIMGFFEGFFEVPFPLPKLDMAAVPDFSAGGMENWGLIIYRESALLYDKELADATSKRRIGQVISHELAHMWFGDLVTPVWWTDLWLNEGFASYVEYLGLNAVDPNLKILDQFLPLDFHKALEKDCLESSHPISVEVGHPDEIIEIFDAISYQKGASIIRMMNFFLTEQTFREALKNYLTDFSNSNAEQDDLWMYLTSQAHLDQTLPRTLTVKEIMDTWTLQMGYPFVSVRRNPDDTVILTQERFLMYKNPNSNDSHDYKWWIPITYTSSNNPDFVQTTPKEWMMPSEAEKTLQGVSSEDDWVIFNIQSVGYFRVNYDEQNWRALANQLTSRHQVIQSLNRAQILDDALNLARAGLLSYEIALGILGYCHAEQEYVPLVTGLENMVYLRKMFVSFDEYELLKSFFLPILLPHYNRVGFDDQNTDLEIEQLTRIEILQWSCQLGHEDCLSQSSDLFKKWMSDPVENARIISPNQKKVVYCTGIAEGGQKEWDFAWQRYQATDVATEKDLLLYAMGCSKDSSTLERYLDIAITENKGIRKQDTRLVISSVANNDAGKEIAWEFLQNRWTDIAKYFGSSSFTLSNIVESTTKYLNTQQHLDEFLAFKKTNEENFLSASQAIEQAEENVRTNVEWLQNSYTFIVQWLEELQEGNGQSLERE